MTPRILAIVEAKTVTGPAKNLIRFASENRDRLDFHFVTYARAKSETEAKEHTNVFIDAVRKAGIPISVLWERGRFDRNVLGQLLASIRSLEPQYVQTHSVKSHFLLSRIRKAIGAPWIAFHHGYTDEDLKMRLFNRMDRLSLPKAAAVVTVCEAFARDLERYGIARRRIHVLHNSLDPAWAQRAGLTDEASAVRASLPDGGKAPVLLCVGRFSKEKGHAVLIEALQRQKPGSFSALLIGDGPLRKSVEEQVRSSHLESSVVFVGQMRDVRGYFAAADMFILPSLSEGSPNVLLEAMSAGVPIVATDVGGVAEIVSNNETALIVPGGQAVPLAAAIERLLEDNVLARELAARARQRLAEHFTPGNYDARLFAIYETVAETARQSASPSFSLSA